MGLEMEKDLEGFIDFFKKVPDHRIERKKLHSVEACATNPLAHLLSHERFLAL